MSILVSVLSCVVSPCVYAGHKLINFADPRVAEGEYGADNSREQFFNPNVYFCHQDKCVSAGPGEGVRIPGYFDHDVITIARYYAAASTGLLPPALPSAIEYCGSAYFDEESGELCACVSEYCHNKTYAMHGSMSCKHAACRPLIAIDTPSFCSFLPGRKRVKFVPVSFSKQGYFHPGIRVVSYTDDSKGRSASVGRSLYLNLEAGETKKEFTVTLLGSTYVIDVEKKMREDLICGTYKEGGEKVYTECVPTPFLPKPKIRKVRKKRNMMSVRFPGCLDKKKCVFELRAGKNMDFPAELSVIIPVVSDDYMFEQYAKCPEGVASDPVSVGVVRAGHLLCEDGSKPELRYLSGHSGNLRCLVIDQPFASSVGISKNVRLELDAPGDGMHSQSSIVTHCPECTLHLAQYRVMLKTAQGRIDTSGYAKLGAQSVGMREVRGLSVEKTIVNLGNSERSLVSDGCPGFPDIPLWEKQELLDLLVPGSQGIVYLMKDDIKRMGVVSNVDSFCPNLDRVPMRYSTPLHRHREALNSQAMEVGDPYDQGLCMLVSKQAKVHAASDAYVGPDGQREDYSKPKYRYAKSGIFKNCKFIRAELYEPGTVGEMTVHLIKNLAWQDGLTAIFGLGHSPTRLQTVLKLCVGSVDTSDLKDHKGSDCIIFPAKKHARGSPSPYRVDKTYHAGNSNLVVIHSGVVPDSSSTNPSDSGSIKLHCVD
ncbi:MAG: hypothetical protein AB8U34_03935 [Anaplasma ovis]